MSSSLKQHLAIFAVGALAFCFPACAQTLYKLIDKNGKVTYSEAAPKNFDGQVIRIDIDPKANTATLPKPPTPVQKGTSDDKPTATAPTAKSAAESAREKVESARKAYEALRDNPGEDDYRFIANAGSGTRRAPTEEYLAKLAAREQALKSAEEEARKAEEGR